MHALTPDDVARLVNEWGTRARAEAGEDADPYPEPGSVGLPDGTEVDVLVRTADRLQTVFAASTPEQRIRRLDGLIAEAGLSVHLHGDDAGRAREEWEPASPADAVLVAALHTLTDVVVARGAAVLGVCEGVECVDVWIDGPRGRPRRYCCSQCGGRVRVAAHRRRNRLDER
ncbi:CGNR zinc finger domain-containing protein [Mumia zhuanghuii]|uniref:Zinc finger CGNR domain-containing protein n=1 Tax=Mumia zhuanghuii TaxID=2585211 RepID=A0A5C4MML0_9ACTN|nr:CGNR zinc finger domain-containing protein [Mumia zhuanghuii]TNC45890.1 hypothetical protein FHE65_14350 [Mumia zhuanghuii]